MVTSVVHNVLGAIDSDRAVLCNLLGEDERGVCGMCQLAFFYE
jgi:hypothetical protein